MSAAEVELSSSPDNTKSETLKSNMDSSNIQMENNKGSGDQPFDNKSELIENGHSHEEVDRESDRSEIKIQKEIQASVDATDKSEESNQDLSNKENNVSEDAEQIEQTQETDTSTVQAKHDQDDSIGAKDIEHKPETCANDSKSETDQSIEPSDAKNEQSDATTEQKDDVQNEQHESGNDKAEEKESEEEEKDDGWIKVLGHDRLKYKDTFSNWSRQFKRCLQKETLKEGSVSDSRPVHGQIATVRCSGELEDWTKVDVEDEVRLTVGDGDVVQAFDLCIAMMNIGDVGQIVTDAKYAYGSLGRKPDIPPNATITYEVELLKVEDAPDVTKLPIKERVQFGDAKRARGNFWFTRGDYPSAINSYTKALRLLDESNLASESEEALAEFSDMRVKCYNNLAAAQLKVEAWDAGIKSCESVLKLQPTNGKAYFRKGKCYAGKGELSQAIACLREAIKHEAESKLIHQELSKLIKKNKVQTQSNKEMYQRMLGTEKKETEKKKEGGSWMMLGGALAAGLVAMGVVGLRYWPQ